MFPQQVFAAYDRASRHAGKRYRYCPACGVPLSQNTHEHPHLHCASCNWRQYQNPAPGVVIVIPEGDSVLLGKRTSRSFAPGKWCLPGGFIEFDEDFLMAAIREVREETGLRVTIRSILSVVSNFLAPELHTLVVVLLAEVVGGKLAAGDDLEELQWAPLTGPFPDLAFEADRHIIERYARTRLEGAPVDPYYAGGAMEI